MWLDVGMNLVRNDKSDRHMKFVIVSPRQRGGGAVVLHTLCYLLNQLGQEASIYYLEQNPVRWKKRCPMFLWQVLFTCYDILMSKRVQRDGEEKHLHDPKFIGYVNESIRGCHAYRLPFVGKKTIVIYPEVVYGNPLHAHRVIRYLLYFNQYDDDAFGKNDVFYAYRNIFNDSHFNPQGRRLSLSHYDLNLYKRTNYGERKGTCYILRKGKNRNDLPDYFDGIVIDDLPEVEKVEIFNRCERCVSYDTQTSYTSIAAICGCLSIIVPEKGKTWKDYLREEDKIPGVAYGFSEQELEWARATNGDVIKRYERFNLEAEENVRKFIKECEQIFALS